MIYILNREGRVIATASNAVNEDDLATRGEVAVASGLNLPLERVAVEGFPGTPKIVELPQIARKEIVLITNADDHDGDGIPDLQADGTSQIAIVARTLRSDGELDPAPTRILFRTSGGALTQRFVETRAGEAAVILTASRETVQVQVTAEAEGFSPARLLLEFIPPD